MSPEAQRLAAWDTILTGFERDLERVRASGAALTSTWHQPRGVGPLPQEFITRAREILAAQTATLARMREDHSTIARHLAALESIPTRRSVRRPVYLDRSI